MQHACMWCQRQQSARARASPLATWRKSLVNLLLASPSTWWSAMCQQTFPQQSLVIIWNIHNCLSWNGIIDDNAVFC